MKLRMAFMGFRHGHIYAIYESKHPDFEIAGACEEDAATRDELKKSNRARITHDKFERMLDDLEFDILAVGDYYARRGEIIIEALRRGKHVISDKPICTRPGEIDEIRAIAAAKNLAVGCQFDLRSEGIFLALRELAAGGELGEIHAVSFGGQHPMSLDSRPAWYFEEGKHGGTINDIAIHAFNLVPWLTGLKFKAVNAARNWNARLKKVPRFRDAAQVMCTLENGAGVLGDVSYFSPDSFGYSLPMYWRVTLWGDGGVAEATLSKLVLYRAGENTPREIPPHKPMRRFYLDSFLRAARAQGAPGDITTAEVISSSRNTLLAQKAADENLHDLPLE
ncbi:MAG: Gfo/Idh/MocA family oxidoreductase [Kiritimatiellia bacterium]